MTAEEYRQADARDRQALESREGYSKDRAGKTTPQLSYYYRNIERCRANSRKYYADHREELLAKKKAERRAHRDFYRAKDAIYRQRKREERLAERARQSGEKSENSDE